MRSGTAIRAKSNTRFQCQECGATELIQAHHEIPGDDSSLIVLCAECHSRKHPDVPRGLFFSANHQPYWENISASSVSRQTCCCSRTIIRRAKILGISQGVLSLADLDRLKNKLPRRRSDKDLTREYKAPLHRSNGFIRKRKRGDKVYYELVESKRQGKKVVQKFIRYLGTSKPDTIPDRS